MRLRDLVARGRADNPPAAMRAAAPPALNALPPEPATKESWSARPEGAKWLVLNSRALDGEQVLVVFDRQHLKEARRAHPGLVVYFPPEIDEINRHKGEPDFPQFFKTIHRVKKRFDGWIIPSDSPLARQFEWPARKQADPS